MTSSSAFITRSATAAKAAKGAATIPANNQTNKPSRTPSPDGAQGEKNPIVQANANAEETAIIFVRDNVGSNALSRKYKLKPPASQTDIDTNHNGSACLSSMSTFTDGCFNNLSAIRSAKLRAGVLSIKSERINKSK